MIEVKRPWDQKPGQGSDILYASSIIADFKHASLIVLESGPATQRSNGTSFNIRGKKTGKLELTTPRSWKFDLEKQLEPVGITTLDDGKIERIGMDILPNFKLRRLV